MENYKNLTLEQLPEALIQMESFTLVFYEDDGTPKKLTWIVDTALVNAFKIAIDFNHAIPAYITAKALHYGFLTTKDGQLYRFGLYDVDNTNDGFLVVGGRPVPLTPLMRNIIKKSFGLKAYSSLHHFFRSAEKNSENHDENINNGEETDHNSDHPLQGNKQYTYTVIFYSDESGNKEGQEFAEKYRDLYNEGLKKVLIYEAKTPKQVSTIKNAIKSGKITRIIYATHGLPAIFDTRYEEKVDSNTCVGLYDKNTTPEVFASYINELDDLMEEDASLLLLSCETAGQAEYKNKILNGKDILRTVAQKTKLVVYAADSKVYLASNPPKAYIKEGSIFYALPGDTIVNVYGSTEFPIASSAMLVNEVFEALVEEW